MLTTSMDGKVLFWEVRRDIDCRCIYSFENGAGISSAFVSTAVRKGMERVKAEEG